MAIITLNASTRALLVSCISVGMEGPAEDPATNPQELEAIAAFLEELETTSAAETELTVMPVRFDGVAECLDAMGFGDPDDNFREAAELRGVP